MARPKQSRKVHYSPRVSYFKPMGVGFEKTEDIVIAPEEVEALRLIEIKKLSQEDAADSMNVSQPTFSRILKSARKKAAEAIVLGKAIKIAGGNALIKRLFSLESIRRNS